MKILHTADWHLGKRLDFYDRLPEQRKVLREITDIAEREKADLILIAGDLFDNFNPSNEAMELLYHTLSRLGKNGQIPVIAIAGNHDSPERINVPDIFARANGVIFIGKPTDRIPLFEIENGFRVSKTDTGFIEIRMPQYPYPVRILHTAFANEIRLKEYFGEDKQKGLQETLAQQWESLAETYCDEKGVNLLTTHLFMQKRGGQELEEPEGEKPLHIGNADVIYSDAIPQIIQYTALGHLHSYQNIGSEENPVVYSSAPLAYSFSETGQQKFVVLIDAEPGVPARQKKILLKSGKALERKTFKEINEAVTWLENHPETLVELTIEGETFMTSEERKKLYQAHWGIIHLIPRILHPESGADAVGEIDLSEDIRVLFRDYFKSKNGGQQPHDEIMKLFEELLRDEL